MITLSLNRYSYSEGDVIQEEIEGDNDKKILVPVFDTVSTYNIAENYDTLRTMVRVYDTQVPQFECESGVVKKELLFTSVQG